MAHPRGTHMFALLAGALAAVGVGGVGGGGGGLALRPRPLAVVSRRARLAMDLRKA